MELKKLRMLSRKLLRNDNWSFFGLGMEVVWGVYDATYED